MLANYFQGLFNLIADSFKFSFKNFKELMPYTWLMVIFQVVGYIELLFALFSFEQGAFGLNIVLKFVVALILYFGGMFFMFKKFFSFLSKELETDEFTYFKTIKALLVFAVFNLIPVLVFIIGILLSKFYPDYTRVLQIIVNIFSIVFYISLSFALVEIAKQKKNMFLAILNSIKIFFKNFLYTFPVLLIVYFIAFVIKFLIIAILAYVFFSLKAFLLIKSLNFFDSILSVLSIYFFATLYLGVQVNTVRKFEE